MPPDESTAPAHPFDDLAPTYDDAFSRSPSARLFRFRFLERLTARVPATAAVLDVGCGTGDDALYLASLGYAVTGVDPSRAMIELARRKSIDRASEAPSPPVFELAGIEEWARTHSGTRYDAVCSDFGALNCAPLSEWTAALARLVRPGGYVCASLLGRRPLPEFLRAGPSAWDRRRTGEASVGGVGGRVRVEYPSRADVVRALSPSFVVRRVEPLGVAIPGPVYSGWPRRHPAIFGALAAAECVLRGFDDLSDFADHFLVEAVRRA